jgi:hypothetical protein
VSTRPLSYRINKTSQNRVFLNPPEPIEYFLPDIRQFRHILGWYKYTHKWNYSKGSGGLNHLAIPSSDLLHPKPKIKNSRGNARDTHGDIHRSIHHATCPRCLRRSPFRVRHRRLHQARKHHRTSLWVKLGGASLRGKRGGEAQSLLHYLAQRNKPGTPRPEPPRRNPKSTQHETQNTQLNAQLVAFNPKSPPSHV